MAGMVSAAVPLPVVKPVADTVAVQVAVSAARWSETVTVPSWPVIWLPGVLLPMFTGPLGTEMVRESGAVTAKVTVLGQVVEAGQVPAFAGGAKAGAVRSAAAMRAPAGTAPRRCSYGNLVPPSVHTHLLVDLLPRDQIMLVVSFRYERRHEPSGHF